MMTESITLRKGFQCIRLKVVQYMCFDITRPKLHYMHFQSFDAAKSIHWTGLHNGKLKQIVSLTFVSCNTLMNDSQALAESQLALLTIARISVF